MKIPTDASPSVQMAFSQIWQKLNDLSNRDVDMKGRRVVNAGTGLAGDEYVTKRQLRDYVASADFTQDATQIVNVIEQTVSGGVGQHQMLSPTHIDSSPAGAARGDIIIANSAALWSRLAKGSAGQVLTSDGTDVAYTAPNLLSATHGDTLAATVQRGDLIVGNSTPKWSRLAKGTSGQALISDGTDANWGTTLATLTFTTSEIISPGNGSTATFGANTELITITGDNTDSSANLLPAGSFLLGVVARVTQTITRASSNPTQLRLGDTVTMPRFATGVGVTSGTTVVGLSHLAGSATTDVLGPTQGAADKLRIFINGTGAVTAGIVRVTVYFVQFVAPTS